MSYKYETAGKMDESFADIFKCAMLCERIYEVEDFLNYDEFTSAVDAWNAITEDYIEITKWITSEDPQLAVTMMQLASEFRKNIDDTHFVSGLIDGRIIPCIQRYLHKYSSIEIEDGRYLLKGTESGFLTVYDKEIKQHYHSCHNPMREANQHADSLKPQGKEEYHIFGCGLGYLAYQLWRKTHGMMDIYIYESDSQMIEYAFMFGPLSLIDQNNLHIEIFEDLDEYALLFSERSVENRFDLYASTYTVTEVNVRFDGEMTDSVLNYNTYMRYKNEMEMNLEYNLRMAKGFYTDITSISKGKEWIVVAAGPSLDDNIDFIRESMGQRIIITVNRCVGRLVEAGIHPDLICVCDPTERIVNHIEGYEEFTSDIPLLSDPNACCLYLKKYRGPKYLTPTSGFPKVSEMIKDRGLDNWNVFGTVTSHALEAAFQMGASKVYLVGVDLAYPGDIQYASEDKQNKVSKKRSFSHERSNDGGMVKTVTEFISFSKQLQEQIYAHSDIEVWNYSKHGLFIPGTRIGAWWEDGLPDDTNRIAWIDKLNNDTFLSWKEKYYVLRQFVDSDMEIDDCAEPILQDIMDSIYEGMITTEDLGHIRLVPGNKMNIQIVSDISELSIDTRKIPDLIINSREKLSGTKLYLKGAIKRCESTISDDVDSIMHKGHRYPYYQLPEGMPDMEFYLEILDFLAKQNGISISCSDPYSLIYKLCRNMLMNNGGEK